jgi:NAD(P)-dependent dehydrogenase (short-subunit alcohol dehydrogenase family)
VRPWWRSTSCRCSRAIVRACSPLSARVGSISDNHLGGWHAYRASKAALNMLLRTFAIELARRNLRAVCVGLHPGTVDTGLSAPFQTNVPEGKLFTPDFAAARLLEVVDRLKPDDSGKVFAWDGQTIPPQAEASRLVSTRRFSLSAVRT